MTFKKGDKVRTEDGLAGEILFVDKGGVEAQVALARVSMKLRTDSLTMYEAEELAPAVKSTAGKRVVKKRAVRSKPAK
jgi:preprotein translocase subunit YajC